MACCKRYIIIKNKLIACTNYLFYTTHTINHVIHFHYALFPAVSRKVEKLGKEKGCEMIQQWQQSIVNHLYWSTHLSPSGDVTVAKWTSLLNHIHNKHKHGTALFPKCLHRRITRRSKKWLKSGRFTVFYEYIGG